MSWCSNNYFRVYVIIDFLANQLVFSNTVTYKVTLFCLTQFRKQVRYWFVITYLPTITHWVWKSTHSLFSMLPRTHHNLSMHQRKFLKPHPNHLYLAAIGQRTQLLNFDLYFKEASMMSKPKKAKLWCRFKPEWVEKFNNEIKAVPSIQLCSTQFSFSIIILSLFQS